MSNQNCLTFFLKFDSNFMYFIVGRFQMRMKIPNNANIPLQVSDLSGKKIKKTKQTVKNGEE